MTEAEILSKVKNGLGIVGTYQDDTLKIYIDEVKEFMKSAGVKQSVINSSASVGCILRGVADLWNYGSGNASLSEYFKQRVIQLSLKNSEDVEKDMRIFSEAVNITVDSITHRISFPFTQYPKSVFEIYVNGIHEEEHMHYEIKDDMLYFYGDLIAGTTVTVKVYTVAEGVANG